MVEAASAEGRAGFLLTRKLRLVLVCIGVPVVEASLLVGLGASWAGGLAAQVSAPAPFGLFHDLRWLVVYQQSVPAFAVELVGLLLFRSVLDAVIVREAWPADASTGRPSFLMAWRSTALFVLVATVLLAPWVMLLFGLAVVSLSWLFFAAVPPVLAVAVLTGSASVSSDWWRRTIPPRLIGWMALTFVVMTACSAVTGAEPAVLAIPVAALGGLFNAWAWRGVVGAATSVRRSRRFIPVAPASLVILLAIVVGGASIGFAVASSRARAANARAAAELISQPRPSQGAPVLIAAGFGTKWDGRAGPWLSGPFDETRFSYVGLSSAGTPLPYRASDTVQSLPVLDQKMAAQVDALAHAAHHKVSLVAVSEGTLVAETYLARYPSAPVDTVILLSPLVTPGRAYYPPSGGEGWGAVSRLGLEAITDTLSSISPFRISPSTPLFQSIVAEAPAIRSLLNCPVPGVEQVAVEPVADAVAAPQNVTIPSVIVPAFHSGTLGDHDADVAITDILEHRPLPTDGGLAFLEHIVRPAAAAWQVPQLALTANPVWKVGRGSVINSNGDASCALARKLIASTP